LWLWLFPALGQGHLEDFRLWHVLCFPFIDAVDGNDTLEDNAGQLENVVSLLLETLSRAAGEAGLARAHI